MSQEEEPQVPVRDIIKRFNRISSNTAMKDKLDIRDDKEKLLSRLRLSREELDTYIRHSKKIIEEKRLLERENTSLKTQIDNYLNKIARLEKFESSLRAEFSQLCKLLSDTYVHKDNDINYKSIRESLSRILQDPSVLSSSKIFSELDKVKDELSSKKKAVSDLQNEIEELTVKRDKILNFNRTEIHNSHSRQASPRMPDINSQNSSTRSPASASEDPRDMLASEDDALVQTLKNTLREQVTFLQNQAKEFEEKALCKTDAAVTGPDPESFLKLLNDDTETIDTIMSNYEKLVENYFSLLSNKATYLDSKAFEFHKNNETLNEEIESLKFALSHRMEVQQMRKSGKECQCSDQIEDLKDQIHRLNKELKNKETELEVAEENKRVLLDLMACMSGNTAQGIDDQPMNYDDHALEDILSHGHLS